MSLHQRHGGEGTLKDNMVKKELIKYKGCDSVREKPNNLKGGKGVHEGFFIKS